MKHFIRCSMMAVVLFSFTVCYPQVNLNWSSSFAPAWANGNTSGNANNVGGCSVNCTVNIALSGGVFTLALGGSGSQTPTVSGATFTVPSSANRVQITPDFANNANYATIVFTFSSLVTNVSFKIVDIDKSAAASNTYFDEVTITGSNNATTYNATITKYDAVTDPNFLVITGNQAHVNTTSGQGGNTASDAADQRGTVNVSFGANAINSITIRYDNAAGTQADPAVQAIGIGQISFQMSTLPVTFSSFSASLQKDAALVKWTTASEQNSDRFEIEKSLDGTNWSKIATVKAAGNSTISKNYQTTDAHLQAGYNYYRLKEIDIDNRYQYSTVASVLYEPKSLLVSVFPNPVSSNSSIKIYTEKAMPVLVEIITATGQLINRETIRLQQGNNNMALPFADNQPAGIYFLRIADENKQLLHLSRLIKQ